MVDHLIVDTAGSDFIGSVSARRGLGKIIIGAVTASIAVAS
jgi:hypothetical protein